MITLKFTEIGVFVGLFTQSQSDRKALEICQKAMFILKILFGVCLF